jgi:hypothetical protein
MKKNRTAVIYSFVLLLLISCKEKNHANSYNHILKRFPTNYFEHQSIYSTRLKNRIIMEKIDPKNRSIDKYIFKQSSDSHVLLTSYKNSIIKDDTTKLESQMNNYWNVMKKFKVTDLTCSFANIGIDLKLYLKNGKRLVYIKDFSLLSIDSKQYIKKSKKINSRWFESNN